MMEYTDDRKETFENYISRSNSWRFLVNEEKVKFEERNSLLRRLLDTGDKAGLQTYVKKVRSRILQMISPDFGKFPVQVVKISTSYKKNYHIEMISLEIMPNYFLPLNVYVPENRQKEETCPAVIVPVGHWPEGKVYRDNKILCANLAARGIICATFDPPCQGERDLFPEQQKQHFGDDMWAVREHMLVGNPLYLVGENLVRYFIYDAECVLNYLVTRADVDQKRIGCTGQSGGGTLTQLFTVYDRRITVSSPIECTTTQIWNLENVGIVDTEQSPFGRDRDFAVDFADYMIAAFPKKIMLNVGTRDSFGIAGLRYAQKELQKLYDVFSISESFAVYEDDCEHVITTGIRRNAYRWFTKWFFDREDDEEYDLEIPENEELLCGKKGKNMAEITACNCSGRMGSGRITEEIIRELTGAAAENYRLESVLLQKENCCLIACEHAGNAYCKCHKGTNRLVHIVLDFENLGLSERILKEEKDSWIVEVQLFGSNETMQKKELFYDAETNQSYICFVQGKSVVSKRVSQILTILRFLTDRYGNFNSYCLDTSGQAGIPAILAGFYDKKIQTVNTERMTACYKQFFHSDDYFLEESAILPGILLYSDIPGLVSAAKIPVRLTDMTDRKGKILPQKEVEKLYASAVNACVVTKSFKEGGESL